MPNAPWSCDRELDAARVRTLVSSHFPHVDVSQLRYFGEGWDSEVFESAGWLFRFPKRAEVERDYEAELGLLPSLARHLAPTGVAIPHLELVGSAGPLFPYKWFGYVMLPGDQAGDIEIGQVPVGPVAARLGAALSALHAFPAAEAQRLGVPASMASRALAAMVGRALGRLPEVASALGGDLADRVRAGLEAQAVPEYGGPTVLVHNDLLPEHILLNRETREVSAIIDWSDTALGDPAVDFAGLELWGGRALTERVLARYTGTVDPGFTARVWLRAFCVGVYSAYFGVMKNDDAEIAWSRAALEASLAQGG